MPTSNGIATSRNASLPRPRQEVVRSWLVLESYSSTQLEPAQNTSSRASRTALHTVNIQLRGERPRRLDKGLLDSARRLAPRNGLL